MDVSFKTSEGRFNLRVSALIINNECLLVMKDEYSPYFYIPGGRINLNEKAEDAIVREIKEELNINSTIDRLVYVGESFFNEDKQKEDYHEICFYYLMNIDKDAYIFNNEQFSSFENGTRKLNFTWIPIHKLRDNYLYPLFIKEELFDIPSQIKFITEKRE